MKSLSPMSGLENQSELPGKKERSNATVDSSTQSEVNIVLLKAQARLIDNCQSDTAPINPGPPSSLPQFIRQNTPTFQAWSPYIYKILDQEKEIRLLKVSRGAPLADDQSWLYRHGYWAYIDSSFKCKPWAHDELHIGDDSWPKYEPWSYEIVHTTLEKAPPFQTISYVWGPDVREHTLSLRDGEVVMINANLSKALPRLSSRCNTGYLWIDQICINQDSITERNHQVKIMGSIYRAGQEVLIWLGALESILVYCPYKQSLHSGLEATAWRHLLRLFRAAKSSIQRADSSQYPQKSLQKHLTARSFETVLGLLDNPWFTRAWIYQEIVLSPKATFVVGRLAVSSIELYWIAKVVSQRHPSLIPGMVALPIMIRAWADWVPWTCRSIHRSTQFDTLLSTLGSKALTTDPRDRIYAFVGLNRNPKILIEPDYAVELNEVLIDTAIAMIRGTNSLDILNFVSRDSRWDGSHRSLPSWVPDFTMAEACTPSGRRWVGKEGDPEIAGFSLDRRSLKTQGEVVHQVRVVKLSSEDVDRNCHITTANMWQFSTTDRVQIGDEICVLRGCASLVVLRRRSDGNFSVVETLSQLDLYAPSDRRYLKGSMAQNFVLV
jgi:hypothetical protein